MADLIGPNLDTRFQKEKNILRIIIFNQIICRSLQYLSGGAALEQADNYNEMGVNLKHTSPQPPWTTKGRGLEPV